VIPPLRHARAAFVFLTRIPVGGFPYGPEEWRSAPAYFPLVGAVVGGITACVFEALRPLGTMGAAYFALGASLLLTGALHEDGLADTSDALGGGRDRAQIFTILKDSRIGVFGACAVVISIAGRAALLAHTDPREAGWGLLFVAAVARAAPVWQIATLPYVTPGGAKSRDVMRAGPIEAALASAWPVVIGGALAATRRLEVWRVAGVLLAAAVTTTLTAWRYRARAGGLTGDFLGATEQLCEIAGLAVIAWNGE
jgi:adenosylcobinamide-GDP ribazoletransferase